MAITTAAPEGVTASAEYGANDSRYATASAGGSAGALSGALAGSYFRTDGFSAATIGSEPDGFRQYQGTGRLRAELAPGFALTATGRYARGRLEIDGYPPPTYFVFDDTAEYQKTREASGRIGALYDAGGLSLNAGLARSDTRRQLFDPAIGPDSYYTTRGRSTRAELFGRAALPSAFALDFGADSEWTRFSTTYDARARARLSSGHALLGWYGSRLTVAAGARIDDHSRFGSAVTLGANANLALNDAWRVRASYGEGFKAPTLFQLLSDYGNAALDPERSRSFDLGVERGERGGPLHFSLTAFRRDSRDLIDFVSCLGSSAPLCANRPFGTYDNVSRARAEGIEAELGARLGEHFSASAAYSYVHATDRATGNDLARRPRHALTLAGDWATPLGGLALGADLRLVSDSYDDAGNFTRLDGYALTTVRAALPLGQRFELFGRVENLFDVTYQTAAGYGTAGRSAFGGVRARF
jgi:vitamin B12 transporter